MKQAILILAAATFFCSCGGGDQSKAMSDQKQANAVVEAMKPGDIPTTEGGWTMTANIDGKKWTAASFRPPDESDWINGIYKEESIRLPFYRRYMIVGNKTPFNDGRMAQLLLSDDDAIWVGKKGEMEITKVNGDWAEGKFYFTASSSTTNKTKEVTDGFFRISLAKK